MAEKLQFGPLVSDAGMEIIKEHIEVYEAMADTRENRLLATSLRVMFENMQRQKASKARGQ